MNAQTHGEPFDLRLGNPPHVQGFLHRAKGGGRDALVLAHGAGSDCHAPLLVLVCEALAAAGMTALRVNLPFRQDRPQGPPSSRDAERDREGLRRAVAALRGRKAERVILGGHSYGARQASILAAGEPEVASGLLLLSYPLHPPRRPTDLRTGHFAGLRIPALFVHGSRDPFGSPAELSAAIAGIPAETRLLMVDGGTHDLAAGRDGGTTDAAGVAATIVRAVRAFLLTG